MHTFTISNITFPIPGCDELSMYISVCLSVCLSISSPICLNLNLNPSCAMLCDAELSMGWVDPRVGLGREWVENLCFNGLGWFVGLKWEMCEIRA